MVASNPSEMAPTLHHVASIIAKGDPPDWLLQGLEHFVTNPEMTTKERQYYEDIIQQMSKATDTLLRFLPLFDHLPWFDRPPAGVPAALRALPGVKLALDRAKAEPKAGRPPNVMRVVCAAVVLEAWKLIHGKAEPRSLKFQQACEEYWQAWGGNASDPENWRRIIERAVQKDQRWIASVFERYKTPQE